MMRTLALLSAVLAVGVSVTDAKLADKYDVPFSIDPACGQFGKEPTGLSSDLSAGYDYSCYESGAYVKRWSTDYELVMSNFLGEDADMIPSLMTYLQGHLLPIIAPILLFGIIAVLSCTCWSCGMLACCAGGNGKPRKCCGKCCANPPKWTEGPMEWILMGVTLFLGVVVVGLAIKGLAVNKVQNDAVVKLGGSITLLEGWMTTSQSAVQNMTDNFDLVQDKVTKMKPTFDNLELITVYNEAPIFGDARIGGEGRIFGEFCEGDGYTDPDTGATLGKFTSYSHGAIRTFLQKRGKSVDLDAETDEVFDVCYVITKSRMIYTDMAKGVVSAREQTDKIETNIASLGDSIDSMGGMTESLEPINSTRNLALKSIWILLVSLMILELCIAFFRQLAPQMTSHCFARFLFGFVTFFYLFVLFILFLVLTVIVVVTVLFGDICKSPDETIVGLIGGAMGGGDDDANTNGLVFTPAPTAAPAATGGASAASNAVTDSLVATSSGGAGVDDGAQLMSYFITCDTDETQNNTFNAIATEAFDYFGVGVTEFNNLYQPFENKTEGFETRKNTTKSTAPGVSKAFEDDAAAMKVQMDNLRVPFYALVESITGQKDGVTDVDVPKQGMQDGLFKIVNCYQVNSRYQAVIGMMCGQFFETIAMTVEYLLVAGVFMVIVEFCKRLMRPYNQAYEAGNKVAPVTGDARWDVAKGREASNVEPSNV